MTTLPAGETVAIIAGNGRLPHLVAKAARDRGFSLLIVQLAGENSLPWDGYDDLIEVDLGAFSAVVGALKARGVRKIVLSGGVRRRPELRSLRPTLRLIFSLPSILADLRGGGDDRVLRMVISLFERHGFEVVAAQDLADDLLVTSGVLGRYAPDSTALSDIKVAADAAHALGALDIGQGAVAIGGRVVAVEGPEGTDEMLARVAGMRQTRRISPTRPGVLVKMCKPSQDMRADLPSIGVDTVRRLQDAGLNGVAVEAGKAFILDRGETIAAADQAGLFIYGLEPESD
ncbi:UDP-2,3-diacylglucosamine diphosphatase LpxI [Martelella sp. HB161492]|uniref:LpxI family protein n=1 Tax=Martelella sp. HB161492 TaxID=2720726 RepID=UPI0015927052|nr:UDP-2,3-diacylglucosamine diphosphatase LpxI [Martelella sp. HB161492]